ncbi:hypothetical protein CYMTET_20008 [Cymbomonas tetramitiformis]|uniref:CW-type domain-containing protein n=1 Tax=Cymbomonas tetramitiformis TaxID=36881 RepID=A0AAE0G5H3_9CHLO|nr:hypothetical protein CYMTET_20008 [Cymbomonas tetramitiformis]
MTGSPPVSNEVQASPENVYAVTGYKSWIKKPRTTRVQKWEVGTIVWAKTTKCRVYWPGMVWSANQLIPRLQADLNAELPKSSKTAFILVLFLGEHNFGWCPHYNIQDFKTSQKERFEETRRYCNQRGLQTAFKKAKKAVETTDYKQELEWMAELEEDEEGTSEDEGDGEFNLDDVEVPEAGHFGLTEEESLQYQRDGLTPDWLIEAGVYIFGLQPASVESGGIINKLLDPCTNDMVDPNIPAAVLYDKAKNGLDIRNSWAKHYVILNPEFKSQIQWRFINRAIDEVENSLVPGILLLCRNSTDAAYFQRLTPYPRCFLKTAAIKFKDYDKTCPGFGITVFCMVKHDTELPYKRFFEKFSPRGEINMPIDQTFLTSCGFHSLVQRLNNAAVESNRDCWVMCDQCHVWRVTDRPTMARVKNGEHWACTQKSTRHGCRLPLTRTEAKGNSCHFYARAPKAEPVEMAPEEVRSAMACPGAPAELQQGQNRIQSAEIEVEPTDGEALAVDVPQTDTSPSANGSPPRQKGRKRQRPMLLRAAKDWCTEQSTVGAGSYDEGTGDCDSQVAELPESEMAPVTPRPSSRKHSIRRRLAMMNATSKQGSSNAGDDALAPEALPPLLAEYELLRAARIQTNLQYQAKLGLGQSSAARTGSQHGGIFGNWPDRAVPMAPTCTAQMFTRPSEEMSEVRAVEPPEARACLSNCVMENYLGTNYEPRDAAPLPGANLLPRALWSIQVSVMAAHEAMKQAQKAQALKEDMARSTQAADADLAQLKQKMLELEAKRDTARAIFDKASARARDAAEIAASAVTAAGLQSEEIQSRISMIQIFPDRYIPPDT